jgi:hypothetical protein
MESHRPAPTLGSVAAVEENLIWFDTEPAHNRLCGAMFC